MNRKRTRSFLLGGLSLAILFLAFLSLWQRDRMTRLGYDIQKMQLQKEKLMKLHKELLIEVESLRAPDRIEEVAMRQLSMMPALPIQRVYVRKEAGQPRALPGP